MISDEFVRLPRAKLEIQRDLVPNNYIIDMCCQGGWIAANRRGADSAMLFIMLSLRFELCYIVISTFQSLFIQQELHIAIIRMGIYLSPFNSQSMHAIQTRKFIFTFQYPYKYTHIPLTPSQEYSPPPHHYSPPAPLS